MGLLVSVYKSGGTDCTNGGITSTDIKGLCVTNIDGPFTPSEDYPAAILVVRHFGFGSVLSIVPEENFKGQHMFGGNYASSSDSRFGEAAREMLDGEQYWIGAVPIHDRAE
tara:strand:+ start:57 stop:389 length:333 start_codon:yes stop_codon:yes gene_type:complete